jgi:4-amino-4-deoxy-L-arabinose transferase-like glycosyltransferase
MDQPLFAPDQGFTIVPFLWLLCYCLVVDSMRANILPKYKVVSIPLISALKGTLQGVSRRSSGRSRPRELGRFGLTRQPYERTRQPEG